MFLRGGSAYCGRACADSHAADRRSALRPGPVLAPKPETQIAGRRVAPGNATAVEGLAAMTTAISSEERVRLHRWAADAQSLRDGLLGMLDDYERLRGVAEAAEQESERLVSVSATLRDRADSAEKECAALRDEVSRLRAESERYGKEREDLTESLSQILRRLGDRQR